MPPRIDLQHSQRFQTQCRSPETTETTLCSIAYTSPPPIPIRNPQPEDLLFLFHGLLWCRLALSTNNPPKTYPTSSTACFGAGLSSPARLPTCSNHSQGSLSFIASSLNQEPS